MDSRDTLPFLIRLLNMNLLNQTIYHKNDAS